MSRSRLRTDPLDPVRLIAAVSAPGRGGIAVFVGVVRDTSEGRPVTALEYTAYVPMANRELADILAEATTRFGVAVEAEHRLGVLAVGEPAVVVAAGHAHRGPAFEACRWVIDELKRRVPIWKREHYADGERAWVDPTATARAGNAPAPSPARAEPAPAR